MTVTRVALINALNLRNSPYAMPFGDKVYAPDLGEALTLTDAGRAAQLVGAYPHASHYEDVPWILHVYVKPATDAAIAALVREFRADAVLTWREAIETRTTVLTSAKLDAVRYVNNGAMAVVSFSGTRKPSWVSTTTTTITGTIASGWGVLGVTAPAGELCAPASLLMTAASAATMLGAGIMPNPAAGYDPFDTTSRSNTVGTSLTSLGYESIDSEDNAGRAALVAMLSHGNTGSPTSVWYQGGTLTANTYHWNPIVQATSASSVPVLLGEVPIPVWAPRVPSIDFQTQSHVRALVTSGTVTATQALLARLPSHHGAFVAFGSFSAGGGGIYDPTLGQVFPTNSDGNVTSEAATITPYGTDFAVAPGVTNSVVVLGSGSTACTLKYNACYLHRG